MKWTTFNHTGKAYDLSHLDGFEEMVVIPHQGDKPEQTYLINVIFSLHCFTRGPKQGEAISPDLAYRDSRETRIFDFDRYEQSFLLPEIIRSLGGRKCFHDPHGNFYVVEVVTDDGTKKFYSVFFTLSKAGKKKGLNLFVSSAHLRDELPYDKNPKPIKFSVLVYNKWRAKPVKSGQ